MTKTMSPDAMKAIMNYQWPGNVRELENLIERLVIMAPGETIQFEQVPDTVRTVTPYADLVSLDIPDEGLDLEAILENAEKTLLRKALEKTGGVKTEAAKLLKLSFRSLRHRLQKYDA